MNGIESDSEVKPAENQSGGLAHHSKLQILLQLMRWPLWSRNLLLFVPAITALQLFEKRFIFNMLFAFVGFCLLSSATYILNDWIDLNEDRLHPTKRNRPLAAGLISIRESFFAFIFLLASWIYLSSFLGLAYFKASAAYLIIGILYSTIFRKYVLLDCLALGGLLLLRIFVGASANQLPVSNWLLASSLFICLSLALLKQFIEKRAFAAPVEFPRNYFPEDLVIVLALGVACAVTSGLVVGLYTASSDVSLYFREPRILWALVPCFIFWQARLWLLANRGFLQEDPLSFAVKDIPTYVLGSLIAAILWLAH